MSEDAQTSAAGGRTALFVSYARADAPYAKKLIAALEATGFEVWWDARIEGGSPFARSIGEALDRADAVLVLWSPRSVASDWVLDEAAVGRGRGRLVPLSLEGAEPPLGFRQYHAISLQAWRGRADAPEMAAIRRAVSALNGVVAPAAPSRPRIARRHVLAAVGGAGALTLGGGLAWTIYGRRATGGFGRDTIAVLPFKNLSAEPQQAYFSAGLTEEVRAGLRRVAALKVMAAASSDAAGAGRDDAPAMARKLGVAWLLEGSVQRAGDTVRVVVDLLDGASGFSRWSSRLDRPTSDLFAIESEIAKLVADAMAARMAVLAPAPGGTTNVAAYEHFLRGRVLFNLGKDEASDREALEQLEQAVALDPGFASAHAARSRILAAIAAEYATADRIGSLYDEAIRAAQRAIDLAPTLAEGQLAMGFALFTGRLAAKRARPFYDRALALARGDADILLLCALYFSRAGRGVDARPAIAQALALDPLNPRTHRAAGSIDYAARRYRDAVAPLRRALQLNPTLSNAHSLIGYCLMQTGDLRAAEAEFQAEPHLAFRLAGLAIVRRRAGDAAGAERWFDRLVAEAGDSALYQQAEVLAQWDQPERAVAALEKARVVGDSGLIYTPTDPMLDPIRGNLRFLRLISDMNR